MLTTVGVSQELRMLPKETRMLPKVTVFNIGIRPANPQLIFSAKFEVNWINKFSEMRQNAQKLQDQSQMTKKSSGLGSPKHAGAAFAHTGIQKQKALTHPCFLREFEENVVPIMYSCVDFTDRYLRNVLIIADRHICRFDYILRNHLPCISCY